MKKQVKKNSILDLKKESITVLSNWQQVRVAGGYTVPVAQIVTGQKTNSVWH